MNNAHADLSTLAFVLRPARVDEADLLSELALRSKAYWGYDADFMAKCVPVLRITPDMIEREDMHCMVAEAEGKVLGYSLLYLPTDLTEEAVLDGLFIDPDAIGKGVGQALLRQALEVATSAGWQHLFVEADPNAETFYLKYGAVRVGEHESGIAPGRMLPWMRFTLS
jgi:GNAT superfamily N-acetyltransferase